MKFKKLLVLLGILSIFTTNVFADEIYVDDEHVSSQQYYEDNEEDHVYEDVIESVSEEDNIHEDAIESVNEEDNIHEDGIESVNEEDNIHEDVIESVRYVYDDNFNVIITDNEFFVNDNEIHEIASEQLKVFKDSNAKARSSRAGTVCSHSVTYDNHYKTQVNVGDDICCNYIKEYYDTYCKSCGVLRGGHVDTSYIYHNKSYSGTKVYCTKCGKILS